MVDHAAVSMSGTDDKWIEIQQKTFTNWVNEQLSVCGRSVDNIATDFCSGVNLVALVESLQFRKIGKVYAKPAIGIQMIQNVSLAFKAITGDNIKLVNIGSEDVVNGNLKLILGLIWHLIIRYQISSQKSKAPPKKLMISWFRTVMPDLDITNFTTDWNDGIALHALLEYLKPGSSPQWRKLHSKNRVENCREAMLLAKEQLDIPRVISPEDFASSALDELSAMTYLSYFVKVESPGYYSTLNWVCKQLRTTTVTNLTVDWNDGFYLSSIVQSLGGDIPGWPNIDKSDHLGNCQRAIEAAKQLGVEPLFSAKELSDPNVDHLSVMAYLSKFQNVKPRKSKAEKLELECDFAHLRAGAQGLFLLRLTDTDVDKTKVKLEIRGPQSKPDCDITWKNKTAECRFSPKETGEHQLLVVYDGAHIVGCPVDFMVKADLSHAKVITNSGTCKVGTSKEMVVDAGGAGRGVIALHVRSPLGDTANIDCAFDDGKYVGRFVPKHVGSWLVSAFLEGDEIEGSPVTFQVYDPQKAWLGGPEQGVAGELVVFTGSPKDVDIVDPGQIVVSGEGIVGGRRGAEMVFTVSTGGAGGNITVNVNANGTRIDTSWKVKTPGLYEFRYVASLAGVYAVNVMWNGRDVAGSPFHPKITDRSKVLLVDDLTDLKDENDHLALECGSETALSYDVSQAGPGSFSAEVLAPSGKLPVEIRTANNDTKQVAFTAKEEGDHYIHLFWSDVPLDSSPILAYCPGPVLPIDASKVEVTGPGCKEARATVPSEFLVNGRLAGPGVPKVRLQGVRADVAIEMKAMKYDRYKCSYSAPYPGGYLLYVYWSDGKVPRTPFKVTVSTKGESHKVKVSGNGLRGGYVGQELRALVDTREAGNGEVSALCTGKRQNARCDIRDQQDGTYMLRIFPTEASMHSLTVTYDREHVPGSPFQIPIGEPPDPSKVRIYGPGIEDGVIQKFESKFIVETFGAGAGQLAVKIKGPRGAFKVEMNRETDDDRTILCRYDPSEPGQYEIMVRWSGTPIPGSPFFAHIFETRENLDKHLRNTKGLNFNMPSTSTFQWKEEI